MKIEDNTAVMLAYTLTDPDGKQLDKSTPEEPFAYLHGTGGIIPGLEASLEGKQAGDAFKITVEPADAYGERNESLVQVVSKDLFAEVEKLEPGMSFHGESDQGTHTVMITAIDGDDVTIDANQPLAGVPLSFDVEVLEVREATSEELEHGHVHGPGGHHHH